MTSTQITSLNDICILYSPNVTSQDTLGEQSSTWNTTNNVACGFNPSPAPKSFNGQVVEILWDAELRLPLTQTFNINYQVTVRSIRYKVDGIATGNGVQIIQLKLVSVND